ncbi:MAG TPA: FxLYD domain-containing protein [Candidatus Paceibacterota bacterium]
MSTRRAKQLIYGALYIVAVLVVCAGIYFVFVAPSIVASTPPVCTPSTCVPTSTALIVPGALTTFITSPGRYTFLAQVTNQSADYGAYELDYAIDLYDTSGTVLQSIPAQSFIYPSQTEYLAILNQAVAQPFYHAALVVTGVSWLTSSTIGTIPAVGPGQFALQNVQASMASTTVSVGGQLVNTAVATYEQVDVLVIFKDANGNPVGVSETQLGTVAAGTTENFSVIYPNEPNIDPAVNQILVYALR